MTLAAHRPTSKRTLAAALAAGPLLSVLLAGCAPVAVAPPRAADPVNVNVASLATSTETSGGSWAVVPMGHLNQPLNTFWQLFYRANRATRWVDEASSLGVATNGGLLLATPGGTRLVVGVLPANLLTFSPVLVFPGTGRAWTPAAPVAALAPHPGALAVGMAGSAVVLSSGGSGEVLKGSVGGSPWRRLTSAAALAASPAGRACGLASLTGVALLGRSAVIGADCRRVGVAGVFVAAGRGWRLAAPGAPSLAGSRVGVLELRPSGGGLCALLAVARGRQRGVAAAWRPGEPSGRWRVTSVRWLPAGEAVASVGPDGPEGLFVLTSGAGAPASVQVWRGPTAPWVTLPPPPNGTSTVAFGRDGTVDALTVSDTTFASWTLGRAGHDWVRTQLAEIPIPFGSSG